MRLKSLSGLVYILAISSCSAYSSTCKKNTNTAANTASSYLSSEVLEKEEQGSYLQRTTDLDLYIHERKKKHPWLSEKEIFSLLSQTAQKYKRNIILKKESYDQIFRIDGSIDILGPINSKGYRNIEITYHASCSDVSKEINCSDDLYQVVREATEELCVDLIVEGSNCDIRFIPLKKSSNGLIIKYENSDGVISVHDLGDINYRTQEGKVYEFHVIKSRLKKVNHEKTIKTIDLLINECK